MNKELEKEVEQITSFQLEEIKGGVNEKTTKCGACCSLLGGGGSASKDLEEVDKM